MVNNLPKRSSSLLAKIIAITTSKEVFVIAIFLRYFLRKSDLLTFDQISTKVDWLLGSNKGEFLGQERP